FLERRVLEVQRRKPPREALRMLDGPLDQLDQALGSRLERGLRGALDLFGQESYAGQELSQAVVQVATDPPLDGVAGLEQLLLPRAERQLRFMRIMDVDAATYEAYEVPLIIVGRNSMIEHISEGSIAPAESVAHFERLASLEAR